MSAAAIKIGILISQQAYKHRTKIVIALLSLLLFIMLIFVTVFSSKVEESTEFSGINDAVLAYYPIVSSYAYEYGIPEYTNIILAIIMIETGGEALDVMQSSESLGLPPNTISDPITSIDAGVKHLASVIKDAQEKDLDYWTPIQAYNYGSGFNNYISNNGKQYTFDLASSFAAEQANNQVTTYNNAVAAFNGYWRYQYGNMYYVKLVQQFMGGGSDIGNVDASPLGGDNYQVIMNESIKFDGWPYAWGGASPQTSFDCSGLMQYVYNKIGYNLPRTAAEQYNTSIPVADPQPGDLVFFKGTNSSRPSTSITHVGIYVDEYRMFNAASSGIGYADWSSGYWGDHFAGFGRVFK